MERADIKINLATFVLIKARKERMSGCITNPLVGPRRVKLSEEGRKGCEGTMAIHSFLICPDPKTEGDFVFFRIFRGKFADKIFNFDGIANSFLTVEII